MHTHRFRVPTHLLVEGTLFSFNLGLFALRLSWRQLAWLLGAAALAIYPIVVFHWPLITLPLIATPLMTVALCGAFVRVNGLPFDRWLLVLAAYWWGRPRRATWQPAPAQPVAPAPRSWVRYRPPSPLAGRERVALAVRGRL